MFSVRLVSADSYQAQPLPQLDPAFSEFRGSEIKHVPIIRVFGSLPTGEKTCLHIHGVFPYLYVPYTGEEDPASLAYRLAASLDAAINVSLGSATSNTQHVYLIQRVSGIPFYGYHKKEHQYLKIYFYNPAMIKRAADLLQNGSVLNRSLQPHEAHIPYVLQFMMDYNVYGMSMINLRGVKHRRITQSLAELGSSGHSGVSENSEIDYLPSSVERQSTCELEMDALASDILNRREIERGLDLNPGLAAIWEEERARRAQAGLQGGDSQLANPKSPPRPTFQPTENDLYQEQRLARRLLMISQCDESTLSTTSNRSVAYAAEVREGENLMNSSNISIPSVQRSQLVSRDDTVEDASLLDSPTIVDSPKLSADCSVLGTDDQPLVDLLVELAGGGAENPESVDTDSVLGSQVSLLASEPRSDNEDEDIPDLNLTSLQLDSLSDMANVRDPAEQRNPREDASRDKSSSSTFHLSPFLTSREAVSGSSRSTDDEEPEGIPKASRTQRMPQYDGAGDVSPTLVNSSSSDDENDSDNPKNAKEFSHLPKYNGTCEVASHSRKSETREQTKNSPCRPSNASLPNSQWDSPACESERNVDRPRSASDRSLLDGAPETDASRLSTSPSSALTSDAYLGQYTAINFEPFDRLLEIGPDFVPDLEGMHSSMEIGILLSSGDSDSPESVIQETDKDTIPLDAVLNGDPCFTESAELDKSDVTELRDQYASLLGNSLLPDVHTNPRIDDDLGSASNFSDSDYQGNEKNCSFSLNAPSPRPAAASRDSSSSSENVTPNIQEPEVRSGAKSKLGPNNAQDDCKEPRAPSDNSDYNCNLVATWAELQNIRQDKRLYRLRNRNNGQWIPGPRRSRRKADRRSLPNITTQLFGRVPESMQFQLAADNRHRSPRKVPLSNAAKTPVKKTKNAPAPYIPVESAIAARKIVETVEEKLSTSPLPGVARLPELEREETSEEGACQPLHTEASLAAFHRSIIGSDNPLAEGKKSPENLYSTETFAESLVEPALPVFEELSEDLAIELPDQESEIPQGTSHYSSRRSDCSSGRFEHRHCTWSARQRRIIQDQVFTSDQIYVIEKRKRGKQVPPDRSVCTKTFCKLPFVPLSKLDPGTEARIAGRLEILPKKEESSSDLPYRPSLNLAETLGAEEPKIPPVDTNEKIVDRLPKRKSRGRRRRAETEPSLNDASSLTTQSSSDDEPRNFDSSDWAEKEGRWSVRRITSDDEARDPYNMRTTKKLPNSTRPRRNARAREPEIGARACRDLPGIPGIIDYPKKRGRQRKLRDEARVEAPKPKPLRSVLFPNWGAEREISESPNGAPKTIANGLAVENRRAELSDRRKGRSLKTALAISPLPTARKISSVKQLPENEALNSMIREVKCPSTRAKLKMLIKSRRRGKFRGFRAERKMPGEERASATPVVPKISVTDSGPVGAGRDCDRRIVDPEKKCHPANPPEEPKIDKNCEPDEARGENCEMVDPVDSLDFETPALGVVFDASGDIFDAETEIAQESVSRSRNCEESPNEPKHDKYAISVTNFFTARNYTIDAVSLEIPTCLFEEDSNSVEQRLRIVQEGSQSSVDAASSLDPRDLDVYDAESLTPSSSFSQLAEATESSLDSSELSASSVLDDSTKSEISMSESRFSRSGKTREGQATTCKDTDEDLSEEDSPEFEALSPSPKICEILGNSLEEQFEADRSSRVENFGEESIESAEFAREVGNVEDEARLDEEIEDLVSHVVVRLEDEPEDRPRKGEEGSCIISGTMSETECKDIFEAKEIAVSRKGEEEELRSDGKDWEDLARTENEAMGEKDFSKEKGILSDEREMDFAKENGILNVEKEMNFSKEKGILSDEGEMDFSKEKGILNVEREMNFSKEKEISSDEREMNFSKEKGILNVEREMNFSKEKEISSDEREINCSKEKEISSDESEMNFSKEKGVSSHEKESEESTMTKNDRKGFAETRIEEETLSMNISEEKGISSPEKKNEESILSENGRKGFAETRIEEETLSMNISEEKGISSHEKKNEESIMSENDRKEFAETRIEEETLPMNISEEKGISNHEKKKEDSIMSENDEKILPRAVYEIELVSMGEDKEAEIADSEDKEPIVDAEPLTISKSENEPRLINEKDEAVDAGIESEKKLPIESRLIKSREILGSIIAGKEMIDHKEPETVNGEKEQPIVTEKNVEALLITQSESELRFIRQKVEPGDEKIESEKKLPVDSETNALQQLNISREIEQWIIADEEKVLNAATENETKSVDDEKNLQSLIATIETPEPVAFEDEASSPSIGTENDAEISVRTVNEVELANIGDKQLATIDHEEKEPIVAEKNPALLITKSDTELSSEIEKNERLDAGIERENKLSIESEENSQEPLIATLREKVGPVRSEDDSKSPAIREAPETIFGNDEDFLASVSSEEFSFVDALEKPERISSDSTIETVEKEDASEARSTISRESMNSSESNESRSDECAGISRSKGLEGEIVKVSQVDRNMNEAGTEQRESRLSSLSETRKEPFKCRPVTIKLVSLDLSRISGFGLKSRSKNLLEEAELSPALERSNERAATLAKLSKISDDVEKIPEDGVGKIGRSATARKRVGRSQPTRKCVGKTKLEPKLSEEKIEREFENFRERISEHSGEKISNGKGENNFQCFETSLQEFEEKDDRTKTAKAEGETLSVGGTEEKIEGHSALSGEENGEAEETILSVETSSITTENSASSEDESWEENSEINSEKSCPESNLSLEDFGPEISDETSEESSPVSYVRHVKAEGKINSRFASKKLRGRGRRVIKSGTKKIALGISETCREFVPINQDNYAEQSTFGQLSSSQSARAENANAGTMERSSEISSRELESTNAHFPKCESSLQKTEEKNTGLISSKSGMERLGKRSEAQVGALEPEVEKSPEKCAFNGFGSKKLRGQTTGLIKSGTRKIAREISETSRESLAINRENSAERSREKDDFPMLGRSSLSQSAQDEKTPFSECDSSLRETEDENMALTSSKPKGMERFGKRSEEHVEILNPKDKKSGERCAEEIDEKISGEKCVEEIHEKISGEKCLEEIDEKISGVKCVEEIDEKISGEKCTEEIDEKNSGERCVEEIDEKNSGEKCVEEIHEKNSGEKCVEEIHEKISGEKCVEEIHEKNSGEKCVKEIHEKISGEKCVEEIHEKISGEKCVEEIHEKISGVKCVEEIDEKISGAKCTEEIDETISGEKCAEEIDEKELDSLWQECLDTIELNSTRSRGDKISESAHSVEGVAANAEEIVERNTVGRVRAGKKPTEENIEFIAESTFEERKNIVIENIEPKSPRVRIGKNTSEEINITTEEMNSRESDLSSLQSESDIEWTPRRRGRSGKSSKANRQDPNEESQSRDEESSSAEKTARKSSSRTLVDEPSEQEIPIKSEKKVRVRKTPLMLARLRFPEKPSSQENTSKTIAENTSEGSELSSQQSLVESEKMSIKSEKKVRVRKTPLMLARLRFPENSSSQENTSKTIVENSSEGSELSSQQSLVESEKKSIKSEKKVRVRKTPLMLARLRFPEKPSSQENTSKTIAENTPEGSELSSQQSLVESEKMSIKSEKKVRSWKASLTSAGLRISENSSSQENTSKTIVENSSEGSELSSQQSLVESEKMSIKSEKKVRSWKAPLTSAGLRISENPSSQEKPSKTIVENSSEGSELSSQQSLVESEKMSIKSEKKVRSWKAPLTSAGLRISENPSSQEKPSKRIAEEISQSEPLSQQSFVESVEESTSGKPRKRGRARKSPMENARNLSPEYPSSQEEDEPIEPTSVSKFKKITHPRKKRMEEVEAEIPKYSFPQEEDITDSLEANIFAKFRGRGRGRGRGRSSVNVRKRSLGTLSSRKERWPDDEENIVEKSELSALENVVEDFGRKTSGKPRGSGRKKAPSSRAEINWNNENISREPEVSSRESIDEKIDEKSPAKLKRKGRVCKSSTVDVKTRSLENPELQDDSDRERTENTHREPEVPAWKIIDENFEAKSPVGLKKKGRPRKSSTVGAKKPLPETPSSQEESDRDRTENSFREPLEFKKKRIRKSSAVNTKTPPTENPSSQEESDRDTTENSSEEPEVPPQKITEEDIESKSSVELKKKRIRKSSAVNTKTPPTENPSSQEESDRDATENSSEEPEVPLQKITEEDIESKSSVERKKKRIRKSSAVNTKTPPTENPSSQEESDRDTTENSSEEPEVPSKKIAEEDIESKSSVELKKKRIRKSSAVDTKTPRTENPSSQEESDRDATENSSEEPEAPPKKITEEDIESKSSVELKKKRIRKSSAVNTKIRSLETASSQEESDRDTTENPVREPRTDENIELKSSGELKKKRPRKNSAIDTKTPSLENRSSQKENDRNTTDNSSQEPEVPQKITYEETEPKSPVELKKNRRLRKSSAIDIKTPSLESDRDATENSSQEPEVQKITDEETEPKSPAKLKRKGGRNNSAAKKTPSLQEEDHRHGPENVSREPDFSPPKSSPSMPTVDEKMHTKNSLKLEKKNRARKIQESSPNPPQSPEENRHETTITKSPKNAASRPKLAKDKIPTKTSTTSKKRAHVSCSLELDDESFSSESIPEVANPPLESPPLPPQKTSKKSSAENTSPGFEELSLKTTKLIIDRNVLKRKKRVRFDEDSIRRNTANLRPSDSPSKETAVEEPSKKHHRLAPNSKPTEANFTGEGDKRSNNASDSDWNSSPKDRTENASSDRKIVDGANGLRENKKSKFNYSDNVSLDLSSLQKIPRKLAESGQTPRSREAHRDANFPPSTENPSVDAGRSSSWSRECVQLGEPIVVLKRLSRDSLRSHGYAFRSKTKKFVKNLKRSGAFDDFRLPAYDGAADLTSSDSEEEADLTIASDEKRVCIYQSGKKPAAPRRDSIATPRKRRLDEADDDPAGPSSKRRATPKKSSNRSPSRTSMLKSPGRLSGYYSPLKIIVTSPKVRKETSESRETLRPESLDAKASSSGSVTPGLKRERLRESMMRGRISATKSSGMELGGRHKFAATMASERSGELDGIASAGPEERGSVDTTISNEPAEATRIRDATAIPRDSRDVRKRLVFLSTRDESGGARSDEPNEESWIWNACSSRDFATIKEEPIELPVNLADGRSTVSVAELSGRAPKSEYRDPYDVTTDEESANDDEAFDVSLSQYVDSRSVVKTTKTRCTPKHRDKEPTELSENLADPESRISVAEPGTSRSALKSDDQDSCDLENDDEAFDVNLSQYVDSRTKESRVFLDRSKLDPRSSRSVQEAMKTRCTPKHRDKEPIELSDNLADRESRISIAEPGTSRSAPKSDDQDFYDVANDEDTANDDETFDVTFSQYIDSRMSENRASLDRSRVEAESNDEWVVVRPKFDPPSRRSLVETMETHGIPKHRNQEPFFSVDADVPKQKELAHRTLRVPGKSLKDVPAFVSSVDGVTGIARWRKMKIKEFIPSLTRSNDVAVKIALCSNDRVVLTPLARPPTRKEAKDWLRAREYLRKKKDDEESRRKKLEEKEKIDTRAAETEDDCSSNASASPDSTGGKSEQERALSRGLKVRLLKKVVEATGRKTRHGSEEEIDVESQRAGGSRKGSGDSTGTEMDPSLLSVLGKSRLFREQEASRHLGASCGQIDFLSDSTRSNVDNENLQNAKALTRYQYLTIMCLEVHVTTRADLLPDAQYDSIAAIFYSVQSDVPPTSTIKPLEHGVIVVAETDKAKNKMYYSYASRFPWSISFVNNEEALLNSLVNLITRVDPEILIGWELETLSWGYVFQRASILGMNLYKRISRIPATQGKWEAQPRDIETLAEVKLPGRIVLDIWRIMRHEAALLSYTFESMMHHVLNERIPCPSFKTLTDWWNLERPRPSRWRVVEHYSLRVLGVFRILDQLDIIGRTSELARLFGIQFFEVFSRGSQYRVESVMLRLAKPLNYIAVSPSAQQRASMRAMEALPLIMEPESMFYSDPLIVLDFQSLYPSIIIAHNYCFSTCLGRIEHIGQPEPFEFGAYTLRVPKSTSLKLQGKVNFAPCGVAFVKPEVCLGVLPRMLTEILETRFMVKKAMKDHKRDDKTLQRALHSRQMGLKFLANVTYGYTAANFSGRMPCIEVGDSVVSKSKETLERAIKLVETTPKWGARVVYGDTDSLFILVPGKSKADAFVIGNEIADAVTAANPPPIKLKFEKVVYPGILQTKKRYCGYMYETPEQENPTYLAKGIETVRRDGCPAVSKILEKTLKILFETKDVSLVKKYVTRQLDKVLRGKVSIQDLTFAKEFRGLKGYKAKACVPALELTKRLMKKDPRAVPRNSERVRYVIVAGAPNQALIHCVRTPWELINDPGLRPNGIYYVTRVIIPPLNRCLHLMGVDVNAWYREMPHRHILDNPVGQPGDRQKLTIFQYFGTIVCAVCGQSSNKGICTECAANPPDALVVLHDKLRRLDRTDSQVTAICQSCVGQADVADCASLDCPVLYRRAHAQRELTQATHLRTIIECGNKLEL